MKTVEQQAALEIDGGGRDVEPASTKRTLRSLARGAARGVTLVEVLIVVAIMAVISGGVTLVAFPLFKESQNKVAVQGCMTVRQAAELYMNLDGAADQCPTMDALVAARRIDKSHNEDPWGTQYKIDCSEPDIHVWSAGRDKRFQTPDDLRDDFKPADIAKVSKL